MVLFFNKHLSESESITSVLNHAIIKLNILEVIYLKWEDVRQAFPEQWILIEAIQAHTNEQSERILEEVAPLKKFSNSPEAMREYQAIHREDPSRELYVLHTGRKKPNIIEKKWVGVRR